MGGVVVIGDNRSVDCEYFDAGACRSCSRMGQEYAVQLAAKQAFVEKTVGSFPGLCWEEPFGSPLRHFRSKAKMVVGGTPSEPTLGILGPEGRGVDLRGCALLGPSSTVALPVLADFVRELRLRPYDVAARSGELKQVHLVESPDGALMIRFVLRSEGQLGKIRRSVPMLQQALRRAGLGGPGVDPAPVVTVNLLREHRAAAEGEEEVVLTSARSLSMRVGEADLQVDPGAFLQTNSVVAAGLYREAARWVAAESPGSVLDLFCGAGGFALHVAAAGVSVTGVEVSAAAVAGARRSAESAGLPVSFEVGDVSTLVRAGMLSGGGVPDVVIVNPPRRGVGARTAEALECSGVRTVVYSSCRPESLASDLAAMPSLRPVRARLFDMFPHTDHAEVLVLLRRG